MEFPSATDATAVLSLVRSAFAPTGGLDEFQERLIRDLATLMAGDPAAGGAPLAPDGIAATPVTVRTPAMHISVVLEMMEHPLRPEVATSVERFYRDLGVGHRLLSDARLLADHHFGALAADHSRHSWYHKATVEGARQGRLFELLGSRLAELGMTEDQHVAARWQKLKDCPEGSWGRGVHEFYEEHGFPLPGMRHGIYEIGARHDWVHVLAGYDTDPEGELDVFAFIAATMPAESGLALLAVTLGVFQNDALKRVRGKAIRNATADALAAPGAVDRFAQAFWRGTQCGVDIMAEVDLFAMADLPLDEVRRTFNIVPPEEVPGLP
jgi:GNAT superfamily N-acetyltransferase